MQTTTQSKLELTRADVRRLAGWSQLRVAFLADCAIGTVRIFELDASAIRDRELRHRLASVYGAMRADIATRG